MIYGTCKGLLASYGVAYADPIDRILLGAFKNMKIDRDGVPVFWIHEYNETEKVVGSLSRHWVSSRGLEGELSISDERAWNHIVEKRARSLSIGFLYNRRSAKLDDEGVLLIDQVSKLFEVTLLPNGYGADPDARIESFAATQRSNQQAPQPHAAQPAPAAQIPAPVARDSFTRKAMQDQIYMHKALARMYLTGMDRLRFDFNEIAAMTGHQKVSYSR